MNRENQTAIIQLKLLGFPIVNIRQALHKLTHVTHLSIATTIKTSRQNVTHHIIGIKNDPKIQQGIADYFGVPVGDLFDGETLLIFGKTPVQNNSGLISIVSRN